MIDDQNRIGTEIAESCPSSPNGSHSWKYHSYGDEDCDDYLYLSYLKCRHCRQEVFPEYDKEDGQVKFPSFFKKKPEQRPEPEIQMETDDNIPGDSAYQPEPKVVDTILLQCPGCYSKVPAAQLLVMKNEGRVVAQFCEQCLSRAVLWAVKSSLGFVLRPPNLVPDPSLDKGPDGKVYRADESMH
jgi:hypothetical protein